MRKPVKYILLLVFLAVCFSLLTTTFGVAQTGATSTTVSSQTQQTARDTTNRFPVKKTQITSYEDIADKKPIDLRDPSNVKTEIVYDYRTNTYLYKTKIGDQEWITPFSMTADEYNSLSQKQSMNSYFKQKNDELFQKGSTKDEFALKDVKVPLGAAERIFGPGGVKIRPQGYVELSMGVKRTVNNNPTLSESRRSTTLFDVDEKINLSVDASIGDKMNFNLNYNTEATFDFDSKRMKLAYEGKEDEIIKYLEAGNVSLNTTNSLIGGSTALFGIRADLQFGKLRVNTVVSQQQSESTTAKSSGGIQSRSFEFKASDYEENRHFFLAEYFRDHYDEALAKLPYINSKIRIDRIEVWVTNKRGNFDQARDIVAFADLAEYKHINDSLRWQKNSNGIDLPSNQANNLYETVTTDEAYKEIRNNNKVIEVLTGQGLELGQDFEKVESARLLTSSEYRYDAQLGYISVDGYSLQQDEVLAVAFSYTINGITYQVGDFASQITNAYSSENKTSGSLILKLLKPTSLSPVSYTWNLMMKNIYRMGAYNIQSDRFRLNIGYQNDTIGTYIDYLTEGKIKNTQLIKVMNLDRLNARHNVVKTSLEDGREVYGDGIFDFVEGYTVRASKGTIIFPVVEPFGSHLAKQIGDTTISNHRYVYQQLYDSTLTVAKQSAEFDKFKIYGSYRASNSNEIDLGVTSVVPGSVRVTAGGVLLTEGVDYTVNYFSGTVTITNTQYSNSQISATVENQSLFNMQTRTLLGMNLSYEFSKDFNIGTTIMHMNEKPINTKMGVGSESVNNTLLGFNTSWRKQSQWLTNLVDKLPFVEATAPSQIQFEGEFAKMFADHYKGQGGGYSYLDDFETSRSRISLRDPYGWSLSSTPTPLLKDPGYQKIENGNDRALLAWYYIDNMFTRRNSSLRPSYITNDDLSNHYVREVRISEIYPFREEVYNETSALSVMNLSFYPRQRGPYNLDGKNIDSEGNLKSPENRWGGMSRKIDTQNFEAANVQYIEFWLLDPFIYNDTLPEAEKNKGGKLYFNLGDISEDVLRDGFKFYENGLGMPGDTTLYSTTVWGHVPKRQSTVYAFDFSDGKDALLYAQDVGFNGLSTEQEFEFPTYQTYLEDYKRDLTDDVITRLENDPFSPLRDPAGDNFHYFRGSDYDNDRVSILDRYKYINGTERNTVGSTTEGYTTSMKRTPDVEDINQDYTMNEAERYYQYTIGITPDSLEDLSNSRITDRRKVLVDLPNGKQEEVKWYQFKIPINRPDTIIGRLNNLSSIRFVRMYMKGFNQTTHLRFATLDLVKGDWRIYSKNLLETGVEGRGNIEITSVNLEENGNRKPVNYVVPPGVSRILDPGQPQLRQDNEQALSMRIMGLESQKERAIYKNTSYDLRRYKRIQMFTHAENFEDQTELKKGNFHIFLRLGTDYQNNYYEYEIPMEVTPAGSYSTYSAADRLAVWPENNMFDFPLELFKNVKLKRNKEKRKAGSTISYTERYQDEYDPDKPNNRVIVKGNPSLSEVNVIMVGIRNTTTHSDLSGEVWINELRMTDFDEEGGWAAKANLSVALSDIGMIQLSGHKETVGFGSIDQSLMERRSDDYQSYSISTSVDAGRFFPKQAKLSLPIYYTYSNETNTPKYDPLDQDVTLKESLSIVDTKHEKDSIKNLAQTKQVNRSFNITGAKLNIRSKTPMPYDPANFTVNYSHVQSTYNDPTTTYETQLNTSTAINYTYSPIQKTWAPFKDSKSKSPFMKFPKALGFNYVPNSISINSNLYRTYNETMTRDLESFTLGGDNSKTEMLTFSGEYYWDRDLALNWDFTKNIKFSIQTGTKAEIEEPFLQVNKKQNPSDYDDWKRSVNNSIRKFGSPYEYRQTATLTYNIPLNTIPILDWVNSSASYNSTYQWTKGAVTEGPPIGNAINNSMTLSINGRFNMVNLYNKWGFLKKVNQKFAQSTSSTSRAPAASRAPRKVTPRKFEKTITLSKDSAITIAHNLKSKNIEVLAKSADGNRAYKIKFKKVDENKIKITTKDSAIINVSIRQKLEEEESTLYKISQYTARGLMSVRNVNLRYSKRKESYIYGFTPRVGDFFGQSSSMVPGMGFAFGLEGDEDFLQKSKDKEWLILSEINNTPATFNKAEKFELDLQMEPFRGLKIDLKAFREKNDQVNVAMTSESNYLRTMGGSFSMTISTLSTAFESSNLKNNYESASFNKFLDNREVLQGRLQNNYSGNYPNEGFIANMNMGNKPYDRDNGTVQNSSADVLIPAFLAAYTGKDANKVGTSPFLALTSMVPNWSIAYDGLTTLPWFKDKFKNFKLMHNYSSVYRIGSYNSYPEWVGLNNEFGFISSAQDAGMIIPSSPYNIMAVSIIESFRPLFGAEGTLKNNMTLGVRYNRERSLNLNISSYQVVETAAKELVITMGYRINEFNRVIGITSRNKTGFNNDLNIKADLSYKTNQALLRKIEDRYTQATAGVDITTLKISADYAVSKMLMLRAYFDKIINTPLISASANPTSDTNVGISIRFTLTQ